MSLLLLTPLTLRVFGDTLHLLLAKGGVSRLCSEGPATGEEVATEGSEVLLATALQDLQEQLDKLHRLPDPDAQRRTFKELIMKLHPDKHAPHLRTVYEELTKVVNVSRAAWIRRSVAKTNTYRGSVQ